MPIFGDDGFRSKFGQEYMSQDFLNSFIDAVSFVSSERGRNAPILIARDTRKSGITIRDLFCSRLNSRGIPVIDSGILPTPGLSHALTQNRYDMGIMITASHNPACDNGVKIFDSTGKKISVDVERKIERNIVNPKSVVKTSNQLGVTKLLNNQFGKYVESIFDEGSVTPPAGGMIIDCANGAFSRLCVSSKFEDGFIFSATNPNGMNINKECGALHTEKLQKNMKENNCKFGVAFDGDGDRAVFVSEEYGVIEAEKLALLFMDLLDQSRKAVVVTSHIVNTGFISNAKKKGAQPIITEVGDRNVVEKALANGAAVGFEPSGHFYFKGHTLTMDGGQSLKMFLKVLKHLDGKLDDALFAMKTWPRKRLDFRVSKKESLRLLELINERILPTINIENERFLARQSIWEPVIKIYYDYNQLNRFSMIQEQIQEIIKNHR